MVLKDDDIVTTPSKPRRRFLARVGASVVGALAVVTATAAETKKRDAKDFIPADSKLRDMDKKNTINNDKRQGDQA